MKSILPGSIFFFICICSVRAQILYGTTSAGGDDGGGTIITFKPDSKNLTVVKSFESFPRKPDYSTFIQASDGKLYGITEVGGSKDSGAIFSFDPSTSKYTKLKDFDYASGYEPHGSLVQASDGKLYGITKYGGINNAGVIFSFDPSTATYIKLKDFNDSDGKYPTGSLIQASDGRLYGLTSAGGGINGYGVIFSYDPHTSAFKMLYSFPGKRMGVFPLGSLLQAMDGKLYGMTSEGGIYNYGVIFSFDLLSSAYTKQMDFNYDQGARPSGNLIQAKNGKLYGMTSSGGSSYGVIFSFDPIISAYTKLKNFRRDNKGGYFPKGSLIQASDGKLYGMTQHRGSAVYSDFDYGVLFSIDPSTLAYKVHKEFDGVNGAWPAGTLMQSNDGKLYGMTSRGGSNDGGVIFSFDPVSSTYTKLKNIASNSTGSNVTEKLLLAKDKMLYGVAVNGGKHGYGVIFSFDPFTFAYKTLHDFDYTNGGNPSGSLNQADDGKLYGMTYSGGHNNNGVIFSYDPVSATFKKLVNLNDTIAARPHGSLIQASDGRLYGLATGRNVSTTVGVIFSFDPLTSVFTKLKAFNGTAGGDVFGSLVEANNRKLYGVTDFGGNKGEGNIFSFDPYSSVYKSLYNFNGVNGANPSGSLIQAVDGKLYGITRQGGKGATASGVIYSFDPVVAGYKTLKTFDNSTSDGHKPLGSLFQAGDGNFYGTTSAGGSNGKGVVFSLSDTSFTFTKLKDFDFANGAYPASGLIEVPMDKSIPPIVSLNKPANNAVYLSGSNVYLTAAASDSDGKISEVKFYNDSTLLYTATDTPYSYKWSNVYLGNYTLTAVATDNSGLTTTSRKVHISVVRNTPPTISITSPANHQTFIAGNNGATINLEADSRDGDGRVVQVSFYNGATLLSNTEHKVPYTYQWTNVPPGTYTITAGAKDNWYDQTTSGPVTITVLPGFEQIANTSKSPGITDTRLRMRTVLEAAPNPAKNIVNIYTKGFQTDKPVTITITSLSGNILLKKEVKNVTPTITLNVSSLASGVYVLKVVNANVTRHSRLVKM